MAATGVLAAAFAASCISHAPERVFELRRADGSPISHAYVGYYHATSIFNFVDSLSRYHRGRLIAADANGRVRIPARWGIKFPLDSRPHPRVSLLYAPELHNALQTGPEGASLAGVVDIDPAGRVITLHDLSADPERWEISLRTLYSQVRYDFWPDAGEGRSRSIVATRSEIEPLVLAIVDEYRMLHARHAGTPRTMPSDEVIARWPREERAERLASIEQRLAREPSWGAYLERIWAKDIENVLRAWSKLAQ